MKTPTAVALLTFAAASASAAGWEATVWAGPTFPLYEQSFALDPRAITGVGGITVDQEGVFRLDGNGGISFGGSLAFYPVPAVGIEGRIDTADVDVSTGGVQYVVRTSVPPFGNVRTSVVFSEGEGDLERLRPLSLNLRLRTPGSLSAYASGGVSYLPGFRFVIRQPVEVAVGDGPSIPVGEVEVPAEALPEREGDGRWGWNAGGGVQFGVAPRVKLHVDVRYFHFQRQTLNWGEPEGSGALGPIARDLVEAVAGELEPARFNPNFFQATGGIALSF
jgi:opacity protein-like surface antigen